MKLRSMTPDSSGRIHVQTYSVPHGGSRLRRLNDLRSSNEILPFDRSTSGSHHFVGTPRFRWRHFSTALSLTPRTWAVRLTAFQSKIMDPFVTDNPSERQRRNGGGQIVPAAIPLHMAKSLKEIRRETRSALYARVKSMMLAARSAKGWSQAKTAKFIGISKADYEKYEGDPTRKVPADVITDICDVLDIDIVMLMCGPRSTVKKRAS